MSSERECVGMARCAVRRLHAVVLQGEVVHDAVLGRLRRRRRREHGYKQYVGG